MPAATDMGGRGSSGGGRGGRDRRGQGTGRGMRRRRRDGRGEGLCHAAGGDSTSSAMTAVMAPIPGTKVPVSAPAVTSRARAVAVVARPESCIACGSCVEACKSEAIRYSRAYNQASTNKEDYIMDLFKKLEEAARLNPIEPGPVSAPVGAPVAAPVAATAPVTPAASSTVAVSPNPTVPGGEAK